MTSDQSDPIAVPGGRSPIAVIVVVDEPSSRPDLDAMVVQRVRSSPDADLIGIVRAAEPAPPPRGSVGWRLYRRLDETLHPGSPGVSPAEPGPAGSPDVPERIMRPPVHGLAGSLFDDRRPELIIDLTRLGLAAAAAPEVSLGVWTILEVTRTDGPPSQTYFAEIVDRAATVSVQILAVGADQPIATGTIAADRRSVVSNQTAARSAATELLGAALRAARVGRLRAPADPIGGSTVAPATRNATLVRATTARVATWYLPLNARRAAGRVIRPTGRGGQEHWRVALRPLQDVSLDAFTMDGFTWVESPKGQVYADPFLIDDGDDTWLFMEVTSHRHRHGVIACARVLADGSIDSVETVIESKGHLSYPYVFRHDGDVFMVPESGAEAEVRLYRATRFPDQWELVSVLHRREAVDTSIWHQDDTWWFFTTERAGRDGAQMQVLYTARELGAPWRPHPANPISVDARNLRGAGALFRLDGALVRPTQDCSRTYGYAFSFRRIDTLDHDDYRDTTLKVITPDWSPGLTATHSYARSSRFEATDGRALFPRSAVW